MRDYGIDSVALQRFVVGIAPTSRGVNRDAINRVLDNVRSAAEKTRRGFFIMYDIAQTDPENWATWLAADWRRLVAEGLTKSPMYQHHRGHPVLAIAGIGATNRPGTPEQARGLLQELRAVGAKYSGLTLLGTVPTAWRTLDHDSKREPEWARVYRSFDILSPWTVGRYSEEASFQRFLNQWLVPDMAEARQAGIEYMPVIFPGFSWHNLYHSERHEERPVNQIPRRCGSFLWMQAAAFVRSGATMLYGAMFDEVDEGTALFKLAANPADLPSEPELLALNEAECNLPSDWYLRLCGEIGKLLKGQITPRAEMPLVPPGSKN
jgi:hypothetical protein